MPQLLVRNLAESLVIKLKRRASVQGVSVEEEHRRILTEALRKPAKGKPSLMQFLLSNEDAPHPEVELDIRRDRKIESHREVKF